MITTIETMATVIVALLLIVAGLYFASIGDVGLGCLGLVIAWAWAKVNRWQV